MGCSGALAAGTSQPLSLVSQSAEMLTQDFVDGSTVPLVAPASVAALVRAPTPIWEACPCGYPVPDGFLAPLLHHDGTVELSPMTTSPRIMAS